MISCFIEELKWDYKRLFSKCMSSLSLELACFLLSCFLWLKGHIYNCVLETLLQLLLTHLPFCLCAVHVCICSEPNIYSSPWSKLILFPNHSKSINILGVGMQLSGRAIDWHVQDCGFKLQHKEEKKEKERRGGEWEEEGREAKEMKEERKEGKFCHSHQKCSLSCIEYYTVLASVLLL